MLGAARVTVCVTLLVATASDVNAQVLALGKGFLLDSAGSVTSDPNEVVSGRNSIKGSHAGSGSFTQFLFTDFNFIHFARSQTYTVTVRYRILVQPGAAFWFGFNSSKAAREGRFGPTAAIRGTAGASGTETLTARLDAYDDYQFEFRIESTGAITVDDIQIKDSAGQLVVSENAEGPTLVPGPLNLQLTDATYIPYGAQKFVVRSAVATDLDGDGYPEAAVTRSAAQRSGLLSSRAVPGGMTQSTRGQRLRSWR